MPPAGIVGGVRSKRRRSQKPSRPSVVGVDWRLPARLRRPVREELERQRRRRRQRKAIVQFERRPLVTAQTSPRLARKSASVNIGAEHHTGDMYRESRPVLAASVPPYAGSFLRQKPAKTLAMPAVSMPQQTGQRTARNRLQAVAGERDVPYQWTAQARAQAKKSAVAAPPRSRFALPLHFSVWPFRKNKNVDAVPAKKKVQNSDFLML